MSTRLRQGMLLGLCTLLGASSCQLTMTELKALNPSAATLEVHCHPSLIPEHVKRFAVQRQTGHIVTDELQDELRSVAPLASVFIEVNPAAPKSSASSMAPEVTSVECQFSRTRGTPNAPAQARAQTAGSPRARAKIGIRPQIHKLAGL